VVFQKRHRSASSRWDDAEEFNKCTKYISCSLSISHPVRFPAPCWSSCYGINVLLLLLLLLLFPPCCSPRFSQAKGRVLAPRRLGAPAFDRLAVRVEPLHVSMRVRARASSTVTFEGRRSPLTYRHGPTLAAAHLPACDSTRYSLVNITFIHNVFRSFNVRFPPNFALNVL